MSQHAIVKDYLLSIGWKPTQYNFKKDKDGKLERDAANQLIKKSPKLTEDSFDSIDGELGKKIASYNTYVHRRRTIKNEKDSSKGWLNLLRKSNDRIPAGAMAWATSTGRAAQTGGLVNVPSVSALYGEPMRRSWICPENKRLVSVDMDSAQIRILANYMGDSEYTQAVTEGMEFDENHKYVATDAHTLHSIAFGTLPQEMVDEARETQNEDLIKKCSAIRKKGKNGYYCLIFGGGDAKLATTLGLKTAADGKRIKDSMFKRLPKLGILQEKLKKEWRDNEFRKGGYIKVAGDTWVWCPSEHKLLNYLLMGSEAALQNEAICWVNMRIKKLGLSGMQLGSFHDELTFEFDLTEEQEGIKIMSEMYGEASKRLGLDVLVTGTAQSGKAWSTIH
jgi:DNA polymerase I-like protein with 3'-5' exonuclease and polymerase domains